MADAISKTVKALLNVGLLDAEGQEMACETATYEEVIDRVETLLLDLCEESGDLAFILLVMCLGSMRLQQLALVSDTWDEKKMKQFIYHAAKKTMRIGEEPAAMVDMINAALAAHNTPKLPPEVR